PRAARGRPRRTRRRGRRVLCDTTAPPGTLVGVQEWVPMDEVRPQPPEVREFCATHGLQPFTAPVLARFAARVVRAQRALDEAYANAGERLENPTIGLAKRMVDRSLDLVAAAICVAHASLDAATE